MKILKNILLIVAVLIAIPLIVAMFVSKDFAVEREIVINKPKEEVFNYIKFIKNQDHYTKWALMDSTMKKEFSGIDGTVGFTSSWESNNKDVGKGSQKIVNISEGEQIDMELIFNEPFESHADAYLKTESIKENQTHVKWGFKSKMPYPMNFMKVIMNMDNMVGNDLATGLQNLKNILEK